MSVNPEAAKREEQFNRALEGWLHPNDKKNRKKWVKMFIRQEQGTLNPNTKWAKRMKWRMEGQIRPSKSRFGKKFVLKEQKKPATPEVKEFVKAYGMPDQEVPSS